MDNKSGSSLSQGLWCQFWFPIHLKRVKDERTALKDSLYAPHIYPILLHEKVPYNSLDRKHANVVLLQVSKSRKAPTPLGWRSHGNETVAGFENYLEEAFNMFDYMESQLDVVE